MGHTPASAVAAAVRRSVRGKEQPAEAELVQQLVHAERLLQRQPLQYLEE